MSRPQLVRRVSAAALAALSLVFGLSLVLARSAYGSATLYVSPAGNDSHNCLSAGAACLTVGAAISKAASGDRIVIAAGTYTEHLTLDKSLTLDGAGYNLTRIDGGGSGRVLTVTAGVTATLDDLTVQRGNFNTLADGAGIRNSGVLIVARSNISQNVIIALAGDVRGGGIFNDGSLTLVDSNVDGNGAGTSLGTAVGGGIANYGTLALLRSSVGLNGAGAAIGNGYGGGVANYGSLTAVNSSIGGNGAGSSSGTGYGGGIYNASSGVVSINNSTIAANLVGNIAPGTGTGVGGGIDDDAGSFTIHNTIVASNTLGQCAVNADGSFSCVFFPANRLDCSGVITSTGHNLIGDATGCGFAGAAGDQVGSASSPIDPRLAYPALNGGYTYSAALLRGSPAIDAGDNANCPPTDQRGQARPVDGDGNGTAVCDIGAYEVALLRTFLPLLSR